MTLGLDPTKKYILYIGRLNHTKRVDLLLDLYKDLKRVFSKLELILAGHEKTDPLYEMAQNSGAILYGKILQTELYKYLSAADVYVLPQYKSDMPFLGIGMLPIQAMLCNTPVVGENLRNYSDKNVHKVGIFEKEYDKIKHGIIKILNQKIVFSNIRDSALSFYSWENISKNTRKYYDKLIDTYDKK